MPATKTEKSAKPVEQEDKGATTDEGETTTTQGVYNGRIKSNPQLGKFFLDVIEVLAKEFDGIPVDDMITVIWGEPREVLEKVIKKANKRETAKKEKFIPSGVPKPPTSALNLYAQRLKEQGIKVSMQERIKKWNEMNEKEKTKYQKEYESLRDAYKYQYEKQRADAIANGEFPEDKPKRGLTAYFHFLADVRAKLTEKHKVSDEEAKGLTKKELNVRRKDANLAITAEASELWKNLDEKKKAKYVALQKRDQEAYLEAEAAWKKRDMERRRKLGEKVADDAAEIVTSTHKKTTPKATPTTDDETATPAENVIIEETKSTTNKAPATKKTAAKATSDDEDSVTKKTATKKAPSTKKPTAKPVTDDEDDE